MNACSELALMLPVFAMACVDTPASREQIRERALREFKQAIFFKPRESSIGGLEEKLAPLLVQEVSAGASTPKAGRRSADYFGLALPALRWNQIRAAVEPSHPTVYAQQSNIIINNTTHKQIVYIWLYPAWPQGELTALTEFFGVRITLGVNGMPLVWEVLSQNRDRRVVFVAESLEQAAKDEFGDPLPGRTFAIERGTDETPDVIVARVISDGPIPFGPYVYLSARPNRDITTVLCRCMPSQVLEFTDTAYFDFRPASQLIPLALHAAAWPLLIELHAVPVPFSEKRSQQPLDEFLRWPTTEPK